MNPNINDKNTNASAPKVVPPTVQPPKVVPPVVKPVAVAPVKPVAPAPVKPVETASSTVQQDTVPKESTQPQVVVPKQVNVSQPVQTTPVQTLEEATPTVENALHESIQAESTINVPASSQEPTDYSSTYKKSNIKKYIFIAVIALLIIIGILFVIFGLDKKTSDKKYSNKIFDMNSLIAVKDGEKYGYIDQKGNIVIKPKYYSANDFVGDYAAVLVSKENGTYNIIDRKGNTKKAAKSQPIYYEEYDVWQIDGGIYDNKFNLITDKNIYINDSYNKYFSYINEKKNESGVVDVNGKVITSWPGVDYEITFSENRYDEENLYVLAKLKDSESFIVNLKTGKKLYSKSKEYAIRRSSNAIFKVLNRKTNVTTWLFLKGDKILYEKEGFNKVTVYDYDKNILAVDDNSGISKYYLVNENKLTEEKQVISYKAMDNYGYKAFNYSGKSGIYKGDKILVQPKYTSFDFFAEELFNYVDKEINKKIVLAYEADKTYLVDLNKDVVIETFNSKQITKEYNTTFIVANIDFDKENNIAKELIIYNLITGKSLKVDGKSEVTIKANYVTVSNENEKKYYNINLEEIYVEE